MNPTDTETPRDIELPPDILKWIEETPPLTQECIDSLKAAAEEMDNDPWFQVVYVRDLLEVKELTIQHLDAKLATLEALCGQMAGALNDALELFERCHIVETPPDYTDTLKQSTETLVEYRKHKEEA